MSVRFAPTTNWKRTTGLPDDVGFTACGWARLVTDTNDFASIFSLDDAGSNYLLIETDADGTSLLGVGSGATVVAMASLTVGTDFFWAVSSSGVTGSQTNFYYRTSTTNALTASAMSGTRTNFTPTGLYVGSDGFAEQWNGRIWNVKAWARALTAAELLVESYYARVMYPGSLHLHWPMKGASDQRDLSGNGRTPTVTSTPTTEDERGLLMPRRRIFLPTSTTQSYSYAASGGLTIAGVAGLNRVRTKEAAGGLVLGGTAATARGRAVAAAGGLSLAGAAAFAKGKTVAPAGGVSFAGTAAQNRVHVVSPAGGFLFSGAADYATSGTQQYSYSASGGIQFGGAIVRARVHVVVALGGLQFGGSASLSTHEALRTVVAAGGLQFGGAASYSTFNAGGGQSEGLQRARKRWPR